MLCCANTPAEDLSCEVVLLDDTVLPFKDNVHFKKNDEAQGIFDVACGYLKLTERDYFGLSYQDRESQTRWLDLYKKFRDHDGFICGGSPHKLHFGVRFFVADPSSLREEITRYLFFLHLKRDILNGKLQCEFRKSTELAALVLQSELGDYKKEKHPQGYASEFRFVANQDEKFENEVERLHVRYSGLTASEAELIYLRKCRQLDMYGLEIYSVQDEYGVDYLIGLSAKGIDVRKNKRKVKTYYWPLIKHIEFKDRQLKIQVKNRNCEDSIYTFMTVTRPACKYLWKRAIELHAFFRMVQTESGPPSSVTFNKKFQHRPETNHQQEDREQPIVPRIRSKRYQSRTSFNSVSCTEVPGAIRSDIGSSTVNQIGVIQGNTSGNEDLLGQQGLFGVHKEGRTRSTYVTPKSERRERNRQLQSLSDCENKHRRTERWQGRSSGEESDSPSKRRIKVVKTRRGEVPNRTRRKTYHTDTEIMSTVFQRNEIRSRPVNPVNNDRKSDRFDDIKSETRSNHSMHKRTRKKHNRLSREDAVAQLMLWEHIHKEPEDPKKYTPKELHDIPYTEVKTEGNPLPIKHRKHGRRVSTQSHRRSSKSSNIHDSRTRDSSTSIGDGLISPLPVTTAVIRDKVGVTAVQSNHQFAKHRVRSDRYQYPQQDWDTKKRYDLRKKDPCTSQMKNHSSNLEKDISPSFKLDHSSASTQV